MYKYVLIVNNEPKVFFHNDEEADACEAYNYTKQFYNDCSLNLMKYAPETHTIDLTKLTVEKRIRNVYRNRGK